MANPRAEMFRTFRLTIFPLTLKSPQVNDKILRRLLRIAICHFNKWVTVRQGKTTKQPLVLPNSRIKLLKLYLRGISLETLSRILMFSKLTCLVHLEQTQKEKD